jgi:flavin reductase (DIM6/NTAB) family NADH-FMN oxidoreductase RutF
MLTTLVGANVDNKPNYAPFAFVGIMDYDHISVAMNRKHYTNTGIKENNTFSVNIPSVGLVKEVDYCGLVSGREVDKSQLFKTFYGVLGTAPMAEECPINMECRLTQIIEFPRHEVFVGEVIEAYSDTQYMSESRIDLSNIQPILFSFHNKDYWKLNTSFAKAWDIGKELKV